MGGGLSGKPQSATAFFIKSFPEFDHSAPLILELSKSQKVVVVPMYSFDQILGHPFYHEVKKRAGFEECRLLDRLPLLFRLIQFCYRGLIRRRVKGAYRLESFLHKWQGRLLTASAINQLFENLKTSYGVSSVVFPTYGEKLRDFAQACRKFGLRSTLMTHAIHVFRNRLLWNSQLDPKKLDVRGNLTHYNELDQVLVPEAVTNENYLNFGVEREKLKIVGSPRFSKSWILELDRVLDNMPQLPKSKKPRVLYLLSKEDGGIFVEEVDRTIRFLSSWGKAEILVKPHPRMDTRKYSDLSNVTVVSHDFHTSELIRKSDLVLFLDSSVVFDGLTRGIPVAHLAYQTVNHLIFSDSKGPIVLNSRDDLVKLIEILSANRQSEVSFKAAADQAVQEWVYAGTKEPIQAYIDQILPQVEKSVAVDWELPL